MSDDTFWTELIEIRRELHRNPELSFEEVETTNRIREVLRNWGLTLIPFQGLETGGYCDVGQGSRMVCFRSDIDALPIQENESHTIVSQIPGKMHACGHDFHTTIGMGLLKYFSEHPDELNGRLRVIFQPGEEAAPGGAEKIVRENIWGTVESIVTVHVAPQYPSGKFILFNGPVQASSTSLRIELRGPGGHTSKPSETADLIQIAGQYVVQLPAYLNQKKDPQENIAFAFGSVHAGSTHNIIPEHLKLTGTLRTFNPDVLKQCLRWIQDFSASFGALYGIKIDVRFPTNCPPTVNDLSLSNKFEEYLNLQGIESKLLKPKKPSMGADDFSFYLQKAPGLYVLIGGGRGHLHSGDLELDESVLQPAVETMAGFISFLLAEPKDQATPER